MAWTPAKILLDMYPPFRRQRFAYRLRVDTLLTLREISKLCGYKNAWGAGWAIKR